MNLRTAIAILAGASLLMGVVLMFAYGNAKMPTALAFVFISILGSTVANAFAQMEARLKAMEERLAKCERIETAP